jgi:hypothetical protein
VHRFVMFLTSPSLSGAGGRNARVSRGCAHRVVVRVPGRRRGRCCGRCFDGFVAQNHGLAFFQFELFDILRLLLCLVV